MPIERLPSTATPEKLTEILRRDGCAVVERLAPADIMKSALDELAPWIGATPKGRDDFAGRRTRAPAG